ncbi:N-acetylmuramic acid 6-phosphate etherase [Solirubrobacter ginsenosidimutans]|uniref:N-acetylmuramic acid 6-phosphate etherase n=1 Tax=Solirubrobacter ginsenosidimutans TaxID=490573 RepID=A0A9X3S332_9ACTN|nr:N-acetylmuramic acid 6-phosphate etherase [Solirubrobacter ginsenosidimutans]MDA0163007.1 N-acetylmuramic acid 6-phosphate etherase [Solirubrobacter ginsenosidimutans]
MTRLGHLSTEGARAERAEIDRLPTGELVRLMNEDDAVVPMAVSHAQHAIAAAVDAIVERLEAGGRLIYVGAGTAGRIGVLDASECGPTFNTDRVVGVIAGGQVAVSNASESAEDNREAGAMALAALGLGAADAVVGISASGRTPYVLGAVERARSTGALTVGVACNEGSELSASVEHPIDVVVGPEFIAGSTRLKAGTAQKLVLNMLSTLTMVRLGKTYGNLMVDVRVTNAKLRDRATRIVEQVAGADTHEAAAALAEAGDDAKVAVTMLRTATNADGARERLLAADGHLRRALGE